MGVWFGLTNKISKKKKKQKSSKAKKEKSLFPLFFSSCNPCFLSSPLRAIPISSLLLSVQSLFPLFFALHLRTSTTPIPIHSQSHSRTPICHRCQFRSGAPVLQLLAVLDPFASNAAAASFICSRQLHKVMLISVMFAISVMLISVLFAISLPPYC